MFQSSSNKVDRYSYGRIFWPLAFIGVFFFPYLGETRVRLEILLFAALIGIAVFRVIGGKRDLLLLPANVYYFSAIVFLYTLILGGGSVHASVQNRAIDIINQNFLFITLFGLLPLGYWLRANALPILKCTVGISIVINIIAMIQTYLPALPFHDYIFALYGGQVGDHGVVSAEFLCRIAHRCTSIFPTLQALALFDLLVIALLMYLVNSKQIGIVMYWVAMSLAFMGGLASVSKTFLIGAPVVVLFMAGSRQLFFIGLAVLIIIPALAAVSLDYQFILGRNISFISSIQEYGLGYIFASRFGGAGYEAGVFEKLYNSMKDIPYIFISGVGSDYRYYKAEYVDHMYLQLVIYGGIPYAALFIVQYMLFFKELSSRVLGAGRRMIYAIAGTHFAIGFAFAVFFIGRYTMLMVTVLLIIALDFNTRRVVPAQVNSIKCPRYNSQVAPFRDREA